MTITLGIDIGSGAVKTALFKVEGDRQEWLAKRCERIRRRDPLQLAKEGLDAVLEETGFKPDAIDYVATTGEGEDIPFATGHFGSQPLSRASARSERIMSLVRAGSTRARSWIAPCWMSQPEKLA